MQKAKLFILMGIIFSLSIANNIARFRQRCYGVLQLMWNARDSFRMFGVSMYKATPPVSNIVAFACATRDDGWKYINEIKSAFPNVFNRADLKLSVNGMWAMLGPRGATLNRYSPDISAMRSLLRRLGVSSSEIECVIDWTNNYWHNYIANLNS